MGLLSQIYNLQFNNQSVELNESIKDCQKLVTLWYEMGIGYRGIVGYG